MSCPICGGTMVGDGHTALRHCEFARPEDLEGKEPDAGPVYCVEIVQEESLPKPCKWRVYYKSFGDGLRYLWSDGKTTRWFTGRDDGTIWNSEDAQNIARAVHLLTGYETGCERVNE